MRISDWSSDVCSSDLRLVVGTAALRGVSTTPPTTTSTVPTTSTTRPAAPTPTTAAPKPTPTTAPAPGPQPTPAPAGWRLVWSDEFDGSAVDTSVWKPYHSTYGDGNRELQCLTPGNGKIGRASCRARECQSVEIWGVAVSIKKKK